MNSSALKILEIRADRLNEKGVFIASQILDTLHGTIDHERRWYTPWKKDLTPVFTFEITNIR